MELFLQATALCMIAVILAMVVRQNREMGVLLSLGVCAAVCTAAVGMLRPVIEFLRELRSTGNLDSGFLGILLKCAGIGLISELAVLICTDAGESAMARAVQMIANTAILLLSLPLLRKIVAILEEVLGRV